MKTLIKVLVLVGWVVLAPSSWAAGLVDSLVSQVGVSEAQASGGAGALLGYAQQELTSDDWASLAGYLPEAQQLAGAVDLNSGVAGSVGSLLGSDSGASMAGVVEAFSGLGLDPSLVSQFAPVILDYLQQQGGGDLVGKLQSLWQP